MQWCAVGFPKIYWHGNYSQFTVMSIELLGETLEERCVNGKGCPLEAVLEMVSTIFTISHTILYYITFYVTFAVALCLLICTLIM